MLTRVGTSFACVCNVVKSQPAIEAKPSPWATHGSCWTLTEGLWASCFTYRLVNLFCNPTAQQAAKRKQHEAVGEARVPEADRPVRRRAAVLRGDDVRRAPVDQEQRAAADQGADGGAAGLHQLQEALAAGCVMIVCK